MPQNFVRRARRFIGVSALAVIVALGGVSTVMVANQASAQNAGAISVQPVAQITVPSVAQPGFADLVEAVKPAVVSIQVEATQQVPTSRRGGEQFNFNMPDLPEDHPLRRFFDQFGDQIPGGPGMQGGQPRTYMAAGSGFVVSEDGFIVTNNHVVRDASRVTVVFDDGSEMDAEVIGTDERTDLAVLKVDASGLDFVAFAEEEARVGDWVVAVGNPFGLGGTVTVGVVSANGRDIAGSAYGDFLQIDAAVNTGNSGGPAFNLAGEVIGVNTAIFSPNGGNVGIAFAIPADMVRNVVDQLRNSGTVTRGYLGVGIQDVSRDIADSVGLDRPRGALITEPTEDGPAAAAGIESGDVIVEINGQAIDDARDLSRTIASNAPGTPVEVTVWRDGAEQTLSVTLAELPTDQAQPGTLPPEDVKAPDEPVETGVGLVLVPDADGSGTLVQGVVPDSTAADKGFAVGDEIVEVDNTAVNTAEEFEAAVAGVLANGRQTALVKVNRGGDTLFIGLPLEAAE